MTVRGSTRVVVLMGGPDAEREISLMSGREVAAALRESGRFAVTGHVVHRPTVAELDALGGDVFLPMLHGPWGEGGGLQKLLDEVGRPYVGSGPRASALAMDKLATKMIASREGVPTPPSRQLRREDACDLEPPLVLKPVDDGSSVGVIICRTADDVTAGRAELHEGRERIMAERFVAGRELTVGVVGGEPLPVIEITPADGTYDYRAKYFRDDTRYDLAPNLPDGVAERCRTLSLKMFDALGCRDLARVDFMLDDAGPWLLEVNTIPGFTTHSLVPMAAAEAGIAMPALCDRLVDLALARRPAPADSSVTA